MKVSELSGGWRMRCALAQVLINLVGSGTGTSGGEKSSGSSGGKVDNSSGSAATATVASTGSVVVDCRETVDVLLLDEPTNHCK